MGSVVSSPSREFGALPRPKINLVHFICHIEPFWWKEKQIISLFMIYRYQSISQTKIIITIIINIITAFSENLMTLLYRVVTHTALWQPFGRPN